jgi:hypothetical protein
MDTSTSTPRAVDFVLGRKVKQQELTQEDWLKIIGHLAGCIEPRLKYMSGMRLLREHMNDTFTGGLHDAFFETSDDVLQSVKNVISPTTQCVELCSLPCDSPVTNRFVTTHGRDQECLHDHFIVLTRQAEMVFIHCDYELKPRVGKWERQYKTKSIVARSISPSDLSLTWMHKGVISEAYPPKRRRMTVSELCEGAIVCEGLYALLTQTIAEKQERLDQLCDVRSDFDRVRSLIEGLP